MQTEINTSTRREYDPDGKISRASYIIQAMLEYCLVLATTSTFLTNLLNQLGFSTATQGVISSMATLTISAEIFAVLLIRRRMRVKRMVIIMTTLNELCFVLLYFTPFFDIPPGIRSTLFVVLITLGNALMWFPNPFRMAWQMSNVPNSKIGVFTAWKEIVSIAGGAVFSFVMGRIIDGYQARGDIRGSFIICGITAAVLMVMNTVFMMLIREKEPENVNVQAVSFRENIKRSWRTTMCRRAFVQTLLANILYRAAIAANDFSGAYQRNVLGFSMTFVSLLTVLYSVFRISVSVPLGFYADKKGWYKMLAPCFAVSAAAFMINVFALPGNGKPVFAVYYCLFAMASAGMDGGMLNLSFRAIPDECRTDAIAWQSAFGGLSGFLSSLAMSKLVAYIESSGNMLFGISVYPQQVLNVISCMIFAVLTVYSIRLGKKTGA